MRRMVTATHAKPVSNWCYSGPGRDLQRLTQGTAWLDGMETVLTVDGSHFGLANVWKVEASVWKKKANED